MYYKVLHATETGRSPPPFGPHALSVSPVSKGLENSRSEPALGVCFRKGIFPGLKISTDMVSNATNIKFFYLANISSCFAFALKDVPNCINKASLPPNLYQLLSAIFSNNQI